jgi:CheY-like chemotaxis protein
VLSEIHIGRFEGIELIPVLRAIPGIEEVPVVLVDDRLRAERREAARQAGAAGYLVRPLDVRKIANGFDQLVRRPRRRRFTRYGQRLAVHRPEGSAPWVTADVGRGGMFLWTEGGATMDPVERFRIALPLAGEAIDVEAEIVHRRSVPGTVRQGAGLRFRRFARDAESRWIAFLRSLDPQATPAA